MEYIKIRFANDFDNAGSKLEKSVTEMFQSMSPMFAFSKSAWKPQLDLYETDDEIIIIAEIAGIEKEELELEINRRVVRLAGRRPGIPPAENGRYRLAEIQYGTFERMLYLPAPVDTEKATASYQKGLLHIRLPKRILKTSYSIPISDE